jgi:hypothetical protein
MLLSAATGASPAALAHLPVGRRDEWLLKLRESTFGSQLSSVVQCPACGERLEMTFNLPDLHLGRERAESENDSQAGSPPEIARPETHSLALDSYEISFRLPDSHDLLALAPLVDAEAARRALFARCLLKARCQGEDIAAEELPEDVSTVVAARMADIDPQADIRLVLSCLSCANRWEEIFDISSFFWMEINAWARCRLNEVHTLATAYGWRERDILEMSARRRELYLNMVRE